jgi:hypothetical protein
MYNDTFIKSSNGCLGMAGFAAGALREKEALRRLQVLDK